MATNHDTVERDYTVLDLRRMDRETARQELTVVEYERWEQLHDLYEGYEETKRQWEEDARVATEVTVFADETDLAAKVEVWGNDILAYYGPEDDAIREAANRVAGVFDVDPDDDPEAAAEELSAEDVDDDDLDAAKGALADLVTSAVVEWNGDHWDDLPPDAHEHVRDAMIDEWGLAGLMDAWVEIQAAVETNRDERLERIKSFRDEKRRGNRRTASNDGLPDVQ